MTTRSKSKARKPARSVSDPIFDVVDRYRSTLAAHNRLFDGADKAAFDVACSAYLRAARDLRFAVAKTPRGLLTKLKLLRKHDEIDGLMKAGLNKFVISIEQSVAGMKAVQS